VCWPRPLRHLSTTPAESSRPGCCFETISAVPTGRKTSCAQNAYPKITRRGALVLAPRDRPLSLGRRLLALGAPTLRALNVCNQHPKRHSSAETGGVRCTVSLEPL
jgi:hypothetical protein